MRYQLADETIVAGEKEIEVPMTTTIPAVMGIDDQGNAVEIEPTKTIQDLYIKRVDTLSSEERQELLIKVIDDDPRPDDRFFWVDGPNKQGKYSVRAKDLDPLKSSWILQVKMIASQILNNSDWQVTKAMETNNPMPQDVKDYRASVRDYSNTKSDAIQACINVEELMEQVASIQFPTQED